MKIVLSSPVEVAPLQGCGFHRLVSLGLSLHRKNIMSIGKDLLLLFSDLLSNSCHGCKMSFYALGSKNSLFF